MKKILIKVGAFLGGFALMALVIYGLSAPSLNNLSKEKNKEVIAQVLKQGGKCADGICSSKQKIFSDGTYEKHNALDENQIDKLVSLIESSNLDYLQASSGPCASWSDGTDIAYSFPTKYGETVYTLCQIQNWESDPLLSYVNSLE